MPPSIDFLLSFSISARNESIEAGSPGRQEFYLIIEFCVGYGWGSNSRYNVELRKWSTDWYCSCFELKEQDWVYSFYTTPDTSKIFGDHNQPVSAGVGDYCNRGIAVPIPEYWHRPFIIQSTDYVSADQVHPHACLEFVLVLKPTHAKAYAQRVCKYKLYYSVPCDELSIQTAGKGTAFQQWERRNVGEPIWNRWIRCSQSYY